MHPRLSLGIAITLALAVLLFAPETRAQSRAPQPPPPEERIPVAANAQPDLFVRHPRPPMLKDYFDPKLRKIIPVIRRLRQVTVKFQVDEAFVPAF